MTSMADINDVTSNAAAKQRIRRLLEQLPPHDDNWRYCTAISDVTTEQRIAEEFSHQRKKRALGRGTVYRLTSSAESTPFICRQCNQEIVDGEMVVCAARAGPDTLWHVDCFVCATCRQQLAEFIYFYKDEQIYCGRHHAETLRPRCTACDEIIFADYCTEAEGRHWHCHHWVCVNCRKSLAGRRYTATYSRSNQTNCASIADRHPVCVSCFYSIRAKYCFNCGQIIGIGQYFVNVDDLYWHSSCYTCDI